jgi:beta-lactamase class C
MRASHRKPVIYASLLAVSAAVLAWTSTSVSFSWQPAKDDTAAKSAQARAAAEEERRRNYVPLVDYNRLDERLQQLMHDERMVGLAVAVVENGEIRFARGYGETVAGSGEAVTTETVFRWASLSKGVAADMVALLAHENKLSLFEPVARHAPSLRLPAGNEQRATVSDLLSHRLGLFAHAHDPKLEEGEDARMLRASMATLQPICPPGSCHAYQNVAYDAASEIVEQVSGKTYPEAVRERLFAPLGMYTASATREGLMGARSWARPHPGGRNSQPVEVTDSYYRVPAAGGVNGSIGDLAIWMLAQMGGATDVLPVPVLRAVQTPRANTPGENARRRKYRERTTAAAYGLGWRMFDYAGHRVVGHHGGVRGYRSLVMFDPVRRAGVVALWNSSASRPNGIEYEVMDMVYRLPFRDWLDIDDRSLAAQPEPAAREDNEGGSG